MKAATHFGITVELVRALMLREEGQTDKTIAASLGRPDAAAVRAVLQPARDLRVLTGTVVTWGVLLGLIDAGTVDAAPDVRQLVVVRAEGGFPSP